MPKPNRAKQSKLRPSRSLASLSDAKKRSFKSSPLRSQRRLARKRSTTPVMLDYEQNPIVKTIPVAVWDPESPPLERKRKRIVSASKAPATPLLEPPRATLTPAISQDDAASHATDEGSRRLRPRRPSPAPNLRREQGTSCLPGSNDCSDALRARIPPSFLISIEREPGALRKTMSFELPMSPKPLPPKTTSHIDIPDFRIVDRKQMAKEAAGKTLEDLSDEAFENHHRKYEREEKRLKNREVEIFKHEQYKRRELALEQWQKEASHRIVIGTAYRPNEADSLGIWNSPTSTPIIPAAETHVEEAPKKKPARRKETKSPRPLRVRKPIKFYSQEFFGGDAGVDEDETEDDPPADSDEDVLQHFTSRYKPTILTPPLQPNRKRTLRSTK